MVAIIVSCAALLIVALGVLVVSKHNRNERIERISSVYFEKTEMTRVRLSKISEEKSETIIIETLLGLKEIEKLAANPLLSRMELSPEDSYDVLFEEYLAKLSDIHNYLSREIQNQRELGTDDEDNPYYANCVKKLSLVDDILEQSTAGSANAIQPNKNINE
jgi:hypothetical protein